MSRIAGNGTVDELRRKGSTAEQGGSEDAVRVLVVDDHVVVRRGIRVLLGTETDIEVVGEAEDGREAVAKAESLRPDVILMDTRATLFVTVFYGVLDPESGTLTYCNAGHNPPYLLEARELGVVRELTKTGMALGLFEGMTWQQGAISVAPGDALVLYTDGIPDAQDGHRTFFGADRLKQISRASLGLPAEEMQKVLMAAVDEFVGDAPQSDDITLMVVTRDV